MHKKNTDFNKWVSLNNIEWITRQLGMKDARIVYYYIEGKRSPSKDTMKKIARVSKGDVPIESWF